MVGRQRKSNGGYVYHVFNRAVGRSTIFDTPGDYETFEQVLIESWEKTRIPIVAFVVMPNHWHIVVRLRRDGDSKWDRGCGVLVFHVCIGGLCGWISTLLAPKLILPWAALRIANLVIAPAIDAAISYALALLARSRGNDWSPPDHALQAFGFAFFFGAARFAFGVH
jgi:hypothetical protein